jgi:hypothetical protein
MINYTINRKKWAQINIFDQMGNIYSEINRTFNAKRNKNLEYENLSIIRVIDLFDATVDGLIKKKSIKAKEVLRAKDQFLSLVYSKTFDEENASSLEKYFMQFAIASRLRK